MRQACQKTLLQKFKPKLGVTKMFNHLDRPEGSPFGPDQIGVAAAAPASNSAVAGRRTHWCWVLNGAVLFTAIAVQARDLAKTRQGEELMTMARGRLGLTQPYCPLCPAEKSCLWP